MNTRILPVVLLFTGFGLTVQAQTKEKEKITTDEKKENIIIRKKEDSKEKLTIIVDGDKITVNGKPIEDLKDIEVLRNKSFGAMMPRIRSRISPMGSLMLDGGQANRPLLGVVSEKTDKGAKVISVNEGSAAEKAGLKKDDIITKVGDNHMIEGSDDLYNTIGGYQPGEKISITYLRDGKTATTSATLGKTESKMKQFNFNDQDFNFERMPGMEGMKDMKGMRDMEVFFTRKPRLGLEIQDLEEGKGVKVLDVDSESPAAKAGIQKDDTITEIDGKAVNSVDELKTKLKEWKEGDSAKITYLRNGSPQTTTVKFPKKLKTADL